MRGTIGHSCAPTSLRMDTYFDLLGRSLVAVAVRGDGPLEMLFEADTTLTVHANPRYEGWELHGPQGLIFVSAPGGRVTTFGANDFNNAPQDSGEKGSPPT